MSIFLLGAAALVGLLMLLRLFVTANPSTMVTAVRFAGVGALGAAAAGLFYLRNFTFGFIAASMAWALYTQGHIWPSAWPTRGFPFVWWIPRGIPGGARRGGAGRSRGGPRAGQTSRVGTTWLDLELHHDSGEMQGMVLQGRFADRALASLSPDDLIALYGEAGGADAETARLLEAYLDRRLGPEWRLKQQEQEKPRTESAQDEKAAPRSRRDTGMSREEALAVLGLQPGAAEDDIRAAHKKLMMQNHPDRGGTDYLAAKINEAKDVLVG